MFELFEIIVGGSFWIQSSGFDERADDEDGTRVDALLKMSDSPKPSIPNRVRIRVDEDSTTGTLPIPGTKEGSHSREEVFVVGRFRVVGGILRKRRSRRETLIGGEDVTDSLDSSVFTVLVEVFVDVGTKFLPDFVVDRSIVGFPEGSNGFELKESIEMRKDVKFVVFRNCEAIVVRSKET
jgi:hypothetical protein